MKTGITVIVTKQVSMDEYRDFKKTKVFDDNSTIGEIKKWIKIAGEYHAEVDKIGISDIDISDIED